MTAISLILVVGGFLGSSLGGPDWLIVLAFLGLFGPFLLRELGFQRWRDDFQREAVLRSGMHALTAVGVLLTVVVCVQGSGGSSDPEEAVRWADAFPAGVIFLLLAVVWGLSWLLQFWGVRTGAFRILLWTMATVTVATVASHIYMVIIGQPMGWHGTWTGGTQILVGWALAFLSRRWPRLTGILLLAVLAWSAWIVGRTMVSLGHPNVILLLILVGLPLLVPAVALLASGREPAEADAG